VAKSPTTIRDTIKAEMARRGLTTYAVWKLVAEHLTKTTVYNYLNGEAELTTANLEHILRALDLSVSRDPR
jgi:predicted transcriptional regulator